MAVAEAHPSVEELAAFTLGTLGEEAQGSVEAHVAACTSCQERAAVAPGDALVELLRSAHTRASRGSDTFVEAAAQAQTPGPLVALAVTAAVAPSAPAAADRPEIPDALPPELARHERYRVVRLLGAGGMGAVYEAEHRVMQRPVALKVIKRAYTASPTVQERFRREVRAAARLSHPNIVTTYDAEDAGQTHFLVMEYVEGTDLGRLVHERGPLAVGHACDYVRQAALGLQCAFEQGMVHRDLKPHNLMLTPGGCVKILDFGLARFAGELAPGGCVNLLDCGPARLAGAAALGGATGSGVVLGTVDYIAPEQADNAHEADIRSDIYSLGCTLYHLVAGRPPFPTGTPDQKLTAHVNEKPQPLTELRDDLPEGLTSVLERLMAKNPTHRYQTPAEVAMALEPFAVAIALTCPPRPRPRAPATNQDRTVLLQKPVGVRRRRLLAITTAILFLVAGLLGATIYRIATDKGELVITSQSEDVKVVITREGKLVDIIDTKTNKQIRLALRSGEYELELQGAPEGLKLSIHRATLKRGETVLATIERVPRPVTERVGEVRRFEGHTNGAWGVAFSPDGRHALSGAGDGTVRLWEVATGREVRRFPGHNQQPVNGVAFSPDGRQALTASWDWTVRLWDVQTGEEIRVLLGHRQNVHQVAFSPDGRRALSGSRDDTMRLWDLASGNELRRFTGGCGVAFSADGRRALSGAFGTVLLCDVETGAEVRTMLGHKGWVTSVVFLPGDRQALSCGHDAILRLWDLESGQEIRRFAGHTDIVNCVAITQDGRCALSASADKTVRVWDLETGKELHCFTGHTEGLIGVALSPDGRHALSSSLDGTVRLWRLPELPSAKEKPPEPVGEVRCFLGHAGAVWDVAFSPDGRRAVSIASDRTVQIWDVATAKQLRSFDGQAGEYLGVAFSPSGELIYAGNDNCVRCWEVETGKEQEALQADIGRIRSVAVAGDGRRLLACGVDSVVLWDLEKRKEVRRWKYTHWVHWAALSPDGKSVLTGEDDSLVRLWDTETGQEVRKFEGHAGGERVAAVAFAPAGGLAASGGFDSTVRVWDVGTGRELQRLQFPASIERVVFLPDGQRLLSACNDGKLYLWDVRNGRELHRFEGHTGPVLGIACSRDGRHALSCSRDGTLRLWRLPDPAPGKDTP